MYLLSLFIYIYIMFYCSNVLKIILRGSNLFGVLGFALCEGGLSISFCQSKKSLGTLEQSGQYWFIRIFFGTMLEQYKKIGTLPLASGNVLA